MQAAHHVKIGKWNPDRTSCRHASTTSSEMTINQTGRASLRRWHWPTARLSQSSQYPSTSSATKRTPNEAKLCDSKFFSLVCVHILTSVWSWNEATIIKTWHDRIKCLKEVIIIQMWNTLQEKANKLTFTSHGLTNIILSHRLERKEGKNNCF